MTASLGPHPVILCDPDLSTPLSPRHLHWEDAPSLQVYYPDMGSLSKLERNFSTKPGCSSGSRLVSTLQRLNRVMNTPGPTQHHRHKPPKGTCGLAQQPSLYLAPEAALWASEGWCHVPSILGRRHTSLSAHTGMLPRTDPLQGPGPVPLTLKTQLPHKLSSPTTME